VPENAKEIWALQQSIQGMNAEIEIAKKQSQTLLVLGGLCLVIPFGILLTLKLDAFAWSSGFACGLGLLFLQMSMATKKALAVAEYTKQYVQLDEMKKRLVELET
jgi:hypothetical protein